MSTKLEIVNIALARLGESPIQSMDEGTAPANLAKVFYDSARRSALRDYNWAFALRTLRLARLVETPVDFLYAYSVPVDCLRVLQVRRSGFPDSLDSGLRFVTRGGVLFTDEESVILEYISDVEEATEFDDKFVEALTYKLASELAMALKGSVELMANYSNIYTTKITQAATLSAGELDDAGSDNPYLEARLYGNG